MKAVAIHEATGKDITFYEKAYSLNTGGKPGQGYPCVLVSKEKHENDSIRDKLIRKQRDEIE